MYFFVFVFWCYNGEIVCNFNPKNHTVSLWTTLESTLYSRIDTSSIFSEHVLNEPRANKLWKLFYGMPLNINKAKKYYHTFVRVEIICNVHDNTRYDSKLMFAWQITFHQSQREWLPSNITKMEILKNWYQIIVKTINCTSIKHWRFSFPKIKDFLNSAIRYCNFWPHYELSKCKKSFPQTKYCYRNCWELYKFYANNLLYTQQKYM